MTTKTIDIKEVLKRAKEDRKGLMFEAGKADREAGYPPREQDPHYIKGYSIGKYHKGS